VTDRTTQKNELLSRRLRETGELIETIKELSKAKDKAENHALTENDLELRFWKRCRMQKDSHS